MTTEKIYNIETGETVEVPLTEEKAAQIAAYHEKIEIELHKEEEKRLAREAIFLKLGLTAEEAAALLA